MSGPNVHHRIPELAARGRIAMTQPELSQWGEALGRALRPPVIIAFTGDLGAGKTTLVQSVCRGAGVADQVTSPTFALVHEYSGDQGRIYHLDLYRLRSPDELTNIGWDDIVNSHSIVLIEWAERAASRLPDSSVHIELEHLPGDDTRRVLMAG
jgi:tRNA threonylcarbamoyladenosine biosynthesis protein TsaE